MCQALFQVQGMQQEKNNRQKAWILESLYSGRDDKQ